MHGGHYDVRSNRVRKTGYVVAVVIVRDLDGSGEKRENEDMGYTLSGSAVPAGALALILVTSPEQDILGGDRGNLRVEPALVHVRASWQFRQRWRYTQLLR